LTPFSNTFGYIFVSAATDLKEVFGNILTPQFDLAPKEPQKGGGDSTGGLQDSADVPEDNIKNKQDIGRALEQIYTDQAILLNELSLDNLDRFWDSFKESRLIRPSAKVDDLEKIRKFLMMKTVVGEFVWLVLCGMLVVSISYNYLLNMGCTFTPEQQKIRAQVLKESQTAAKKKEEEEKNKISVVTA
jgi:hypothetical protein